MRRGLRLSLALLLILVASCAGQPDRVPIRADWARHRALLDEMTHWTASGKLALRTSEQAESASLLWRQTGVFTHLRLSGPLGLSATTIDSDGRQLEIRQGDEYRSWDISSPDAIAQNTGWDLPLGALPHWLKGVPAPGFPLQLMELEPERELLRKLEQEGWEIHYETYAQFDELILPTQLRIRRGTTSAQVIIRDWQKLSD
jgi:outer membrane lipoprotein LolB